MPHVAARVASTAALIAVAMVLVSAGTVFAKSDPDNPNGYHDGLVGNPGNHYGQLKHQQPVPPPTPAPTTTPVVVSPAPTARPASDPTSASKSQPPSTVPDLPVTLPAQASGQVSLTASRPADDGLWWLLLLILPLLLAIWVVVATRLVVNVVRRMRVRRPVTQMAAATT